MKRWGITIPFSDAPLSEHRDAVRALVDLGYTDVFSQETAALDAFTPLASVAAWAPELRIGTAIASVFTRGPGLLAMSAAALAEAAPGRFVLGLGTSSRPIVEGWNGLAFDRPLARMRDTLSFLRAALAGERIDRDYETFAVHGFRLERVPQTPPRLMLAALGPRMLELAGATSDGVQLSLVAPEDVARIVDVARAAAGARAGELEVVQRIGVVVSEDAERARGRCRRLIAGYLSVDRYAALHRWLGRGDLLAPMWRAWEAGDRRAAQDAIPDALVDALFVHGSAERCRAGIERFVAAGVTTPVIALMDWDGRRDAVLRGLAPGH
ncbi:MAG: LLM class F420-dependent oxidoreductase [Deltaproteobacteria bacterium]|nr:LLM class F420-dependent oxidoreductase [Deltaproteobacteria bacterium]MBW2382288.1 LLM class F420-dependent oxidoreductase [Deltaproteobacteria bacterium]